jgi:hypothetical protein
MSRIHLSSNTLVLWLSLSAAVAAGAASVGCSSSDSGSEGSSGQGGGGRGGATATAGSTSSEAGEPAVGGGDSGQAGSEDTPTAGTTGSAGGDGTAGRDGTAGTAGTGGSAAGGMTGGGEAGEFGEGGSAGSPDVEDPRVAAAQARALLLINGLSTPKRCTTCHDTTYQGSGFFPNITPDVTNGIGSWTEEEIKVAIRDGKDKDGVTLCATMERYPFTDEQLSDLAIFLKHLPPMTKKITAKCPSL